MSRSLVFTGPQTNINTLNFLTLNGTLKLCRYLVAAGRALLPPVSRRPSRTAIPPTTGLLRRRLRRSCASPMRLTPLTNAAGQTLPDISDGGALCHRRERLRADQRLGPRRHAAGDRTASRSSGHAQSVHAGRAVDYASTSFYTGAQIGVINSQLLVLPSNLIVDTPENSPAAGRQRRSGAGERRFGQQEPGRVLDRYVQCHARPRGDRERPLQHRAYRSGGSAGQQSDRLQPLRSFQSGDRRHLQGAAGT